MQLTHGRLWSEASKALDHLQNEQVAVPETDELFWVTGRRIHAL